MGRVSVTLGGLDGALTEVGALPAAAREAANAAAELTARATRLEAIRLTTRRYNLDADTLDPYVVGSYGKGGRTDGWSSVTLLARPVPIQVFNPAVRMRTFRLVSRGRRPKTYSRSLPTIVVKRMRQGSAKQLHPYFPLHQRTSGPLSPGDAVRRRIGSGRGDGRSVKTPYSGNKLTGVRYYTFPKRFLDEIKPQLVEFVGDRGQVELRGALRKRLRDQRVLRGPR